MTDQARMVLGLVKAGSEVNEILLTGVCSSEAEAEFIIEQLKLADLI